MKITRHGDQVIEFDFRIDPKKDVRKQLLAINETMKEQGRVMNELGFFLGRVENYGMKDYEI